MNFTPFKTIILILITTLVVSFGHGKEHVITFLGDSLTAGYKLPKNGLGLQSLIKN